MVAASLAVLATLGAGSIGAGPGRSIAAAVAEPRTAAAWARKVVAGPKAAADPAAGLAFGLEPRRRARLGPRRPRPGRGRAAARVPTGISGASTAIGSADAGTTAHRSRRPSTPGFRPGFTPWRGSFLPPAYQGFVVDQYWLYHLRRPPAGYHRCRSAANSSMISASTGLIFDVVNGQ